MLIRHGGYISLVYIGASVLFFYLSSWCFFVFFFFSSRRRHTRYIGDWSSDVCSSDLCGNLGEQRGFRAGVIGRAGGGAISTRGDDLLTSEIVVDYRVAKVDAIGADEGGGVTGKLENFVSYAVGHGVSVNSFIAGATGFFAFL